MGRESKSRWADRLLHVLGRVWYALGRLGLLHARTRAPVLLFVLVLAVLGLERLAIAVSMRERFAEAAWGELARAFVTGVRFDLVVAAMVIVPLFPMLFLTPPRVLTWRPFRWMVAGYASLALTAVAFLCVADYFYFEELGERLNHKVIEYVGATGNEYLLGAVVRHYPVFTTLGVCALLFVAGVRVFGRAGFDDHWNVGPLWQAVVWPVVAIALTVLAIRGTVGSHAINAGIAYFTPSQAVAQLTLNGGFTLRQAIVSEVVKDLDLAELYPLLPEAEAMRITRELVIRPGDRELGNGENPLRRVVDSGRPRRDLNVVVVVLESLSWHYVGALGGEPGLTPNLDALIGEGLSFDRCFAVGGRTQRGFAGIVSGFPDLPKSSVTTRDEVIDRFITLGSVLKGRGYETAFVYGGPAHRDHRAEYLGSNGYDRMITEDELATRTFATKLGWCDGDLLQSLVTVMDEAHAAGRTPLHTLALTVTFHAPYDVPPPPEWQDTVTAEDHPYADQRRAIRYTDWAIGRFMAEVRSKPWYDQTLFVFVADHMGGYRQNPQTAATYRVPFVVIGAPLGDLAPRRVEAVCNQMDVAPTLMALLGGSYKSCFFGSSVLDRPGNAGFAVMQTGSEEILFMDGSGDVVTVSPSGGAVTLGRYVPPGKVKPQTRETVKLTKQRDALAKRAVAVVQTADLLFERGLHRVDEPAAATIVAGK